MTLIRSILLGWLLLASACSMDTAIERMSSPEDRAFARGFVEDVRAGRAERLQPQVQPGLWAEMASQLPQAKKLYPAGQAETKLLGYSVNSQVGTGGSVTTKQYVLVTTDGKRWTETLLATEARDGTTFVVGWNIQPFDEPSPTLRQYEQYEAAVPWLRAGLAVVLIAGGLLVFWLVRRYRRRRNA